MGQVLKVMGTEFQGQGSLLQQWCHSGQGSIPTPGSQGAPGAEMQWDLWVSTLCSLAAVLLLVPPTLGTQCGFICPGCLGLLGLSNPFLFSFLPLPPCLGQPSWEWEGVRWAELTISLPSLVSPYPAFPTADIIPTRGAREGGDKNQREFE